MSYGADPNCRRGARSQAFEPSTDWERFTFDRLLWLYEDTGRARQVTPRQIADQAAWRSLGTRSAA